MTELDYSEENLDEFMLRASKVLSEENHPDKTLIINSLKEHLISIFKEKPEMENFFKTLNLVIFSEQDTSEEKIINSCPFKLYSLVFSFNPKTSYYYMDYFLTSLQKSCSNDFNIKEFPFLIKIFAEVIKAFYSDEKSNKFLINKSMLLEFNKKNKLYEKIFNFCNNNIKSNEKTKQSFGCLLLNEFIIKCPLLKDEKNFENAFKSLSEYLDDHWFESKLDLLHCVLSLIHTQGKKFKHYANVCLFKILDFFTDEDWMKRKIAVNIVYTLTYYCKEEILNVKDNIIDFLSVLKDDSNDNVKEMCIKTLNFIEECDPENNKNDKEDKDEINDVHNIEEKIEDINQKNNNIDNGMDNINIKIDDNEKEKENKNKNEKIKVKDNIKINIKNNVIIDIKDDNKKEIKEIKNKNIEEKENKKSPINKIISNEHIEIEKKKNNDEKIINIKIPQIKIRSKTLNDKYGNTLDNILSQMKQIQETQNILNNYLENVKITIDQNYSNLNERLKILENNSS